MNIQGKRILLTGATGGIGMAIARQALAGGAKLLLTGRQRAVLEQLAQDLGGKAAGVEVAVADLSVAAELDRLIAAAGQVDILIANAGLPGTDEITAYSPEEIETLLKVNLHVPILLARALLPGMTQRGEGHLLFISSIAGKVPSPLSSLYSASKYGLRGFADCLRMDLDGTGVGVSTIYPGMIRDAGMFANSGATLPKGTPSNTAQEVAESTLRAIERNLASVNVASPVIGLGVHLAHFSPGLNLWIQNLVGAKATARQFSDGHRARK